MDEIFCDVFIVGAGIIGSSLALRLAQAGITVVIIDNHNYFFNMHNIIPSSRVSAINYASLNFFKKINIWNDIPNQFLTSYYDMKVWELPYAIVTFNANLIGLKQMGCIVENNRLQLALWKNIMNSKLVTFYYSSNLVSLKYQNMLWKCVLNTNIVINSKLLIGADGFQSEIRNQMKIPITTWKHHQCCMLLTVKTEKNISGTIWQMFTPNGPIGFLPLYNNWGSLMWFNTPEYIDKLKFLPKSVLEKKIEKKFCNELGKVILYNISVIPVINQRANKYVGLQTALIGDAAHAIHPLAGQGINLGIRDVIQLSELLDNVDFFSININNLEKKLLYYQDKRQLDIYIMQSSINWLYYIFHNNVAPLKIARNFAFMIIENIPYIKKELLKYAVLGVLK